MPAIPAFNTHMDTLVEKMDQGRAAGQSPGRHGFGASISALGRQCRRAAWLSLRWATPPQPFSGRTLRLFQFGIDEEAAVIKDLQAAGLEVEPVDPATGQQWRVEIMDGWIRGYADGIIRSGVPGAEKTAHVLEIKTMKAVDWNAVKKHGVKQKFPSHWHQINTYMVGLKIPRGIYIAVNRNTLERYAERLEADPEAVRMKAEATADLLADEIGPDILPIAPDKFPCAWCDHKAVCREGAALAKTCRSCRYFAFTSHGNGLCGLHDEPRNGGQQRAACDDFSPLFGPAPAKSTDLPF